MLIFRGVYNLLEKKRLGEGTLPETNSEFTPENGWLEYFLVSFWGKRPIFRGHVSFREGNSYKKKQQLDFDGGENICTLLPVFILIMVQRKMGAKRKRSGLSPMEPFPISMIQGGRV